MQASIAPRREFPVSLAVAALTQRSVMAGGLWKWHPRVSWRPTRRDQLTTAGGGCRKNKPAVGDVTAPVLSLAVEL